MPNHLPPEHFLTNAGHAKGQRDGKALCELLMRPPRGSNKEPSLSKKPPVSRVSLILRRPEVCKRRLMMMAADSTHSADPCSGSRPC